MTDHAEELKRALEFRYADAPDDGIITVHTYPGRFLTKKYLNTPGSRNRIVEDYAGYDGDVWSRITTVRPDAPVSENGRGLEKDTYVVSVLHVDIDPDPVDDETIEQWRERTVLGLQRFRPRPSRIELSGRGVYALWKLETPTEDWERAKRINKWLEDSLAGDDCYDVSHILRLPGTKNPKPGAEWARVLDEHNRVYVLDDFAEADYTGLEQRLQELAIQAEVLPLDFEAACRKSNPKLWDRIYSEASAMAAGAPTRKDRTGAVDRSENDFYIACALLRMGRTEGEVYSVLTHETWFSGEKFRHGSYRDGYVLATIAGARDQVEPEPLTKIPAVAEHIMQSDTIRNYLKDWYWYDKLRGVYVMGDVKLKQAVQALSGEKWRPDLQNGVFTFLEGHADVYRDHLNDTRHLNTRNGMLDVTTGEMMDHAPSFNSTWQINAAYDPEVDCTEVDTFVRSVLPDDAVKPWWMFSGYCLYTEVPLPYRGILFLVGPRRTGKSTLLNALRFFLGRENCSSITLTELTEERTTFTTSNLIGKLLNVDSEADYQRRIKHIQLLKALGSGEEQDIEKKYAGKQSLLLPVKLAFAMNGFPKIGSADDALLDRMLILQTREDIAAFTMDNPLMRPNAHLTLLGNPKNRAAWLRRSIEGLMQAHQHNGIPETQALRNAKFELQMQEDSVFAFWQRCSEEDPRQGEYPIASGYSAYEFWCAENGAFAETSRQFSEQTKKLIVADKIDGMRLIPKADKNYARGRRITYRRGATEGGAIHL